MVKARATIGPNSEMGSFCKIVWAFPRRAKTRATNCLTRDYHEAKVDGADVLEETG